MGITEIKKSIRREISSRKKLYSTEERIKRSESIAIEVKKDPKVMEARNILLYWSMKDEVFTHALIAELSVNKNVYLPVVSGDNLLIKRYTGDRELVKGESFEIPEPPTEAQEVPLSVIDVVIVPGVAFDLAGGRMGRGKGFYDRLFAAYPEASPYKIGICFDFQVVDSVPREEHDIVMDRIITEKRPISTRISELFGIRYPIIAGGMVWCSGWRLAGAVSHAGGLGLIGAGSMKPELLREHIRKCKKQTDSPFGVNIPLISPYADESIRVVLDEEAPVIFTSAGSPKKWTSTLHEAGIKVVHVVSSSIFALKAQDAGVDAVVAEGFEAGGHNGKEETATMVLIPQVSSAISIPLIAAGGIATGAGMAAAFSLGAEGVQMGTRFALSAESSAHESFKKLCINLNEGDTLLSLKSISPTRLVRNSLFEKIDKAEKEGASVERIKEILGRGKARDGIFDGDLENGELEIGQIASLIRDLPSSEEIILRMVRDFHLTIDRLARNHFPASPSAFV